MQFTIADCSGRFGAFIDDLLAGRLENECSFELEVTPNEGADNYSLSLRLAGGMFEFSLHARGIDNADERYSESILHWYVDAECTEDVNVTNIELLSEYEHWFVNVRSETRIIASFSIGDDESYVFANRPKQLDFI